MKIIEWPAKAALFLIVVSYPFAMAYSHIYWCRACAGTVIGMGP